MSALVSLPGTAPADDVLEVLARDGCVILERLADAATMDAVATDLKPDIARTPTGTGEFVGHKTTRTHTVLVNSRAAGDLALHPAIAALNDAVLGPYCARYQLSSAAAIAIGPGETMQELHRDDLVYPLAHPSERQSVVTAIWALSDFSAANGATLVVPGSHRWDDEREPALADGGADAPGVDESMREVGLSVLRPSGLCAPYEHTTTIAGRASARNPKDTIMALHRLPPNPDPLKSTTYGDEPLQIPPKSTKWSAILLNMG